MTDKFRVGCRVRSPFGDATVTQVDELKVMLSVDSVPQLRLEYAKDKLTIIQPAPQEASQRQGKELTKQPSMLSESNEPKTVLLTSSNAAVPSVDGSSDLLQAIEALRFGLVPTAKLAELTLGYEKAKNWILSRLPPRDGNRMVSQVNGAFGTGKSHMMALVRYLAMKEGYVVAQVEVDGSNVSLSQPATLLAKLWQSIKAQNLPATNPLLSLYLQAAQNGLRGWQISQDGLHRTKGNLDVVRILQKNGELDLFEEALDAFISGSTQYTAIQIMREIRRQSLYYMPKEIHTVIGRNIDKRANDFIDSLVSNTLVAVHAGYKGLIITIDELETEYNLPVQYFSRAEMLVETLYQYMDGQQWPEAPLGMFFAAVGQEGHQGDAIIDKLMSLFDGECYWDLKPWPKSQRSRLAKKIYGLYAYNYHLDGAFQEDWFEGTERNCRGDEQNIRAFIKRFVARLDEDFGPPEW